MQQCCRPHAWLVLGHPICKQVPRPVHKSACTACSSSCQSTTHSLHCVIHPQQSVLLVMHNFTIPPPVPAWSLQSCWAPGQHPQVILARGARGPVWTTSLSRCPTADLDVVLQAWASGSDSDPASARSGHAGAGYVVPFPGPACRCSSEPCFLFQQAIYQHIVRAVCCTPPSQCSLKRQHHPQNCMQATGKPLSGAPPCFVHVHGAYLGVKASEDQVMPSDISGRVLTCMCSHDVCTKYRQTFVCCMIHGNARGIRLDCHQGPVAAQVRIMRGLQAIHLRRMLCCTPAVWRRCLISVFHLDVSNIMS